MVEDNYFNFYLRQLNNMQFELDQSIKAIKKGNRVSLGENTNPITILRNNIYKIKDYYEKLGVDLFNGKNYIKFAYLAYTDAVIEEMCMCLGVMIDFSEMGLIGRLRNYHFVKLALKNYAFDLYTLKTMSPEQLGRYIKVLLFLKRDFEAFKPGMFYKFITLVTSELKEVGIDFTQDPHYNDVMGIIRLKEEELADEELDIPSFDEAIATMSKKYNVDLVSLGEDSYVIKKNSI